MKITKTLIVTVLGCCLISGNTFAKKVLFIDSYHEGYAWSDGITSAVKKVIGASGNELKIIRMDTKRNGSEEFIKEAAKKAKEVIDSYKPDVVIAADDNASKYVIAPNYKDAALPFVFCGVNWDAGSYGFPCKNITGMVEVSPVPLVLKYLKMYAKGDRVGVLAPDNITSQKNIEAFKKNFGLKITEYLAKNAEDYKNGFAELQTKCDMLILVSDGGLYDKTDVEEYCQKNTKIPTGSMDDFMAPKALISFTKLSTEQGEWAAKTALEILDGKSPAEIPIAKNEKGDLYLNMKIAQSLGITFDLKIVKMAKKIIK